MVIDSWISVRAQVTQALLPEAQSVRELSSVPQGEQRLVAPQQHTYVHVQTSTEDKTSYSRGGIYL